MTYQPIRWSNVPRSSGFTRPVVHALAIRQMSCPEVEDGREDRTHLDDGGVGRDGRVVDLEAEELLGDRQVTGARHREELGEPLDDPEDDCLEVVHLSFLLVRSKGREHPTHVHLTRT